MGEPGEVVDRPDWGGRGQGDEADGDPHEEGDEVMKSGELFAGVGGLGMAVDRVFKSKPAYFCEFDAAPSKVLAHHFPEVPNFGDVTKVDFTKVPHTHVRCGGFPCQDVSLGGRRAGMKDGTRSGLWSEFARSIAEDRPDWVVIENVRGLLSADATGGNLEPCSWCVGDESGEHALRALGAVLADLADLGFDAEWIGVRASDVGAPHQRLRIFILAWPRERTVTDARRSGGRGRTEGSDSRGRDDEAVGSDPRGDGRRADSGLTLLPTPAAATPNDGESAGQWQARHDLHAGKAENATRSGMPLSIAVQGLHLLPTPIAERAATNWGPYADAIAQWEEITGRPAPAPVLFDGRGGKPRLSAVFVEWLMGWPEGWVSDPAIELTRREILKACGNGVVDRQAEHAVLELLARPGVPSISEAVAA